ncbi:hypothetical protein ACFXK0_21815 [Nocardia sp. NPDC059177]|uniref:hypothetical protein n=1 Tax=Nocardia sp. NPDC059177 TaxID=3346759 RepID=UPI0036836D30
MLTFLIALALVLGLALLIGRGTAGSTGAVDRDRERIAAELTAIAGYADHIPRGHS